MGDKTPADLCVIAATDLKVDNSSLTGESEPQERKAVVSGPTVRAVEAENLVFNSTSIVSGEAWGGGSSFVSYPPLRLPSLLVVVRTGDHTFIGQSGSGSFELVLSFALQVKLQSSPLVNLTTRVHYQSKCTS